MNDKAFENKVNQDVDQVKENIATVGEDSLAGLDSIKRDLVTLGDDVVTRLSRKLNN